MTDPVKQQLRRDFVRLRDGLDRASIDLRAGAEGMMALIEKLSPRPRTIALYAPIRSEARPDDLRTALLERGGFHLALPVAGERGQPLVFRRWNPGDEMATGFLDIAEPLPEAETLEPDIVIAPLLAFDARGNRLGYGRGDYDRTLAALRGQNRQVLAIGLAFAAQEADTIPAHEGDEPLDGVMTERGLRLFRTLA